MNACTSVFVASAGSDRQSGRSCLKWVVESGPAKRSDVWLLWHLGGHAPPPAKSAYATIFVITKMLAQRTPLATMASFLTHYLLSSIKYPHCLNLEITTFNSCIIRAKISVNTFIRLRSIFLYFGVWFTFIRLLSIFSISESDQHRYIVNLWILCSLPIKLNMLYVRQMV